MLAVFVLIALLVSDAAEAACPASRSRSEGQVQGRNRNRGPSGRSATLQKPRMIKVPQVIERAVSCPSRPRVNCETAATSKIIVRDDRDDSKDRFVWRWNGATKAGELDIGDPSQSTTVGLCVYDSFEDHSFLVTSMRIEPGAAWSFKESGAWHYKSTGNSSTGIRRMAVKVKGTGKTRLGVKARGTRLRFPLEPATRAKLYHQDDDVLVQLVNSANGRCWTSSFPTAAENSTVSFVAPRQSGRAAVSAGTR